MQTAFDKHALTVGVLAMLAGSALLQWYLRDFERSATGGAKIDTLVVTRDAKAGEPVDRALLGTRAVPEAYLDSRDIHVRDLDQVLGQTLVLPCRAGDALLWSDLRGFGASSRSLASFVQEGMRAVTLHDAQDGVSALLRPGDRVDVIATSRAGDAPLLPQGSGVRVLLDNVLVLAVGGQLDAQGSPEARGNAGQVTLSVTLEQAQLIAQAEPRADLRLLLRNPDDTLLHTGAEPTR